MCHLGGFRTSPNELSSINNLKEQFDLNQSGGPMQRIFLRILLVALLTDLTAYGQSLGDVARENREKQSAEDASAPKPKVITNKDLSAEPDGDQDQNAAPAEVTAKGKTADRRSEQRSEQQRLADRRVAEQWKKQILAQESKMVTLQERIDQLHASIRSVAGSAQYEGPANRTQALQQERLAQVQLQLDEQKRKLEAMQEDARRAGMHTTVYDP
jgi:AraC-like DNA-binding protein